MLWYIINLNLMCLRQSRQTYNYQLPMAWYYAWISSSQLHPETLARLPTIFVQLMPPHTPQKSRVFTQHFVGLFVRIQLLQRKEKADLISWEEPDDGGAFLNQRQCFVGTHDNNPHPMLASTISSSDSFITEGSRSFTSPFSFPLIASLLLKFIQQCANAHRIHISISASPWLTHLFVCSHMSLFACFYTSVNPCISMLIWIIYQ